MTPLKLLITLVRGELLRNTKKFAKMDTYVVARLGSTVFKTKICKCGGINPYWDDKFTTDLQDDDRELCLEVWEHDFGNHILLASGKVDASDVKSSTSQTLWVKVNSNESYAGQVLLHVRCETTDHVFENAENFVDPYIQKNIFQQRRSTNIIYLGEPAPSISIAKLLKEEQERQDKIFLEDKQSQRERKTRNPLDGKISKNEGVCYFFQSNSNNRLTLLLQSKFLGVLTLPTNQIRVSKSLWTLQISRKI
mgnify:CR=1 FL=1